MRPSTKITLGFILICATYQLLSKINLQQHTFHQEKPGQINFIGIKQLGKFKIITSNKTIYLAENKESSPKKYPIKLIVNALKHESEALTNLAHFLHNLPEFDKNNKENIWQTSDLQQALINNNKLKNKLEKDLNTSLNGQPKNKLSEQAYEQGILIEYKIKPQNNIPEYSIYKRFIPQTQKKFDDLLQTKFQLSNKEKDKLYIQFSKSCQSTKSLKSEIEKQMNLPTNSAILHTFLDNFKLIFNEKHILSLNEVKYKAESSQQYTKLKLKVDDLAQENLRYFTKIFKDGHIIMMVNDRIIATSAISETLNQNELTVNLIPIDIDFNEINSIYQSSKSGGL